MKLVDKGPLNLLVAYPYLNAGVVDFLARDPSKVRLLVDSGAFTAWRSGGSIDLDSYCRFLDGLPVRPWRYFALDVIGDAKATQKNYEIMLARGFRPIPIFTRGEDPSYLDDYYKTSDVVGIGGLVGTPGNFGFVKGIMRTIGDRKVHWLGFTSLRFLKAFKPYMADSSSWETSARYASCSVYLGNGQPFVQLNKRNAKELLAQRDVKAALIRYGFRPEEFLRAQNWCGGLGVARRLSAASYRQLSCDVERHLNTKLFLAATTKQAVEVLLGA